MPRIIQNSSKLIGPGDPKTFIQDNCRLEAGKLGKGVGIISGLREL
jgi:hypothetical protein